VKPASYRSFMVSFLRNVSVTYKLTVGVGIGTGRF
jgi:hypothetical protein